MKTIRDLRKRVQKGMVFHCENYVRPETTGPRTVIEALHDGIWYTREGGPGPMYTAYPTKNHYQIEGETITFFNDHGAPRFMFDFTDCTEGGE